ncbi:MAG: hypothetical protein G01um101418_196 [Parcubacteria group bacterium Gr01-1014_18]|nr:MAG: hypothetical protein Greene041636_164 [Parcubacteria group bacterium Greene0416_36]TSC81356.1 MAG: hypothetical protein G01um101418_196 [Parcubacteria group bacterium Gr01-1014_18]TSC99458.1 MAG: hypothetical protein Greene101420_125 [Parcubacteria group bacterium Greene1014_20]TSD07623.1 MAG: hypothetical protein Greene07142_80 [Parcubacteria group bacterium Greene0714_2]
MNEKLQNVLLIFLIGAVLALGFVSLNLARDIGGLKMSNALVRGGQDIVATPSPDTTPSAEINIASDLSRLDTEIENQIRSVQGNTHSAFGIVKSVGDAQLTLDLRLPSLSSLKGMDSSIEKRNLVLKLTQETLFDGINRVDIKAGDVLGFDSVESVYSEREVSARRVLSFQNAVLEYLGGTLVDD